MARVEGQKEIMRKLRGMDRKIRRKVLRSAMRKGLKPVRDSARANAPRRTSHPKRASGKPLHKTIVIRSARKRRGHDEQSMKVTHTRDGAHAHLVEFGTGPRYQRAAGIAGAGRYVGEMPAQPYMRPAYDAHGKGAIRITAQELEKGIAEALR